MKKNLHPNWYSDTNVYCNGDQIIKTNSTKKILNVEIWSGNHPFFTGSLKYIDSEGRVERFEQQYFKTNAYNSTTNS